MKLLKDQLSIWQEKNNQFGLHKQNSTTAKSEAQVVSGKEKKLKKEVIYLNQKEVCLSIAFGFYNQIPLVTFTL